MEFYTKPIKTDKYNKVNKRGGNNYIRNIGGYKITSGQQNKPVRIYLNKKKELISGNLNNKIENKNYLNSIKNIKNSGKQENLREQEMHYKRPQSYVAMSNTSQNNYNNPNNINNNRIFKSSIDAKEIQINNNMQVNYRKNNDLPGLGHSYIPQINKTNYLIGQANQANALIGKSQINKYSSQNAQRNYRKPQEKIENLLKVPKQSLTNKQILEEISQKKGIQNNQNLEKVSLNTPSKKEPQNSINLMKGTESSHKIESSSKKKGTLNNSNRKNLIRKKKLDVNFKNAEKKDDKNQEKPNPFLLRAKPFADKAKDSKEIQNQNDSAKKNIVNIKKEVESESLEKDLIELINQIKKYKTLISQREKQIKEKDIEIKIKNNKIIELTNQIEKAKKISELNNKLEEKIQILNSKIENNDANKNSIDELKHDLKNKEEIIFKKDEEISLLREKINKALSDLKKLELDNENLKKMKQNNNFNNEKLIQKEKKL